MMRPLLLTAVVSLACFGFSGAAKDFKDENNNYIHVYDFNITRSLKAAEAAAGADNIIDRNEYIEFSKIMLPSYAPAAAEMPIEEMHGLFNLMDVDQNNELSIKEYVLGALQYQEFNYYDTNPKDNLLSDDELMKMFDTPDKVNGQQYYSYSGHASFVEFYHRFLAHSKLNIDWQSTLGLRRLTTQ
ncbi:hypothetical protein LSTR_LSTR005725 [Laodelphax striatellus]|uniref:EF-hand domain-containing protein n=1 Tax=Laodelphax striatellus TaxID=195883 RepID=A0A482XI75_LAOST|nr:hypothetical protein LSTR_LSTR005725 [Laodelphax striatellus]